MDYDVILLGGGLAYTGAELLRNAGLKVAIVEKDPSHLGGVCLHRGCVPTKLYLFEARKAHDLKNSSLLSIKEYDFDLKSLKEKKERLTKKPKGPDRKAFKGCGFYLRLR